ncbi:hypothetical protein B0H34DRAFT_734153 [Crassisporium funariophilum]|nr:hypothetical protein B0H34DRAFT_734153 [Crassisporium funariophilum]
MWQGGRTGNGCPTSFDVAGQIRRGREPQAQCRLSGQSGSAASWTFDAICQTGDGFCRGKV